MYRRDRLVLYPTGVLRRIDNRYYKGKGIKSKRCEDSKLKEVDFVELQIILFI